MRYLFLFSMAILFAACKKKQETCTVDCSYWGATISFQGYTVEEVDTIYVKYYQRNGLFDSIQKDTLVSKPDSLSIPQTTFTCLSPIRISTDFDYQISIPSTGQMFRIAPAYKVETANTPCERQRPCELEWPGATITGGDYTNHVEGPWNTDIILKK